MNQARRQPSTLQVAVWLLLILASLVAALLVVWVFLVGLLVLA